MWGWGMARQGDQWSAVMRHGNRAVWVNALNQAGFGPYPLQLDELIRAGLTHQAQSDALHLLPCAAVEADQLEMGMPLPAPGSILGIGLNYTQHARDLGQEPPSAPGTFLRALNTLALSGQTVWLPTASQRVTAEGEVALILGSPARDLTPQEAARVIWGAATVLDFTAEDILRQNPRFLTRAKGYDGFFILSAWLVPWQGQEFATVRRIVTRRNGHEGPADDTSHMLWDFTRLVSFASDGQTLPALSIISSGTPGAVVVAAGDLIEAAVDGLWPATCRVGGLDSPERRH